MRPISSLLPNTYPTDNIVSVPKRFMGNNRILNPLFLVNYGTMGVDESETDPKIRK